MAELIIKVKDNGPDPAWRDGDILHAFNDERISCYHLSKLCDPALVPRINDLLPEDSLPEVFDRVTCQYKYERLDNLTVRATEISTLLVIAEDGPRGLFLESELSLWGVDFEGLPLTIDGRGRRFREYDHRPGGTFMDVPNEILRKTSNTHRIYGITGNEIWYGGTKDYSNLSAVWDEAEARSAISRTERRFRNYPNINLKKHLAIPVDDFSLARRAAMEDTVYNVDETLQKIRAMTVAYDALYTSREVDDIRDPQIKIDRLDDTPLDDGVIVQVK